MQQLHISERLPTYANMFRSLLKYPSMLRSLSFLWAERYYRTYTLLRP